MWILIFVVSTSGSANSGAAAVNQEFSTKENCMTAQQQLLAQTKVRATFVLHNMCVPK